MLSSSEKKRVYTLFHQFGCNEREIEIYLQMLTMGPASIQEIAHAMNQNRVTVHSAVEQLIDKGFLYQTRKGKRRLIGAENPRALHDFLQRKENELSLMRASTDFVSDALASLVRHDRSKPSVKIYEGVDGLKKMLEETLETQKEILVFSYVHLLADLLDPDYLEAYFKRRAKQGINTRLIFPPCDFAQRVHKKSKQYRIKVRLMPREAVWRSGIFCWDNKLALLSYTENRITCTIIENPDITEFFRNILFELSWKNADLISS